MKRHQSLLPVFSSGRRVRRTSHNVVLKLALGFGLVLVVAKMACYYRNCSSSSFGSPWIVVTGKLPNLSISLANLAISFDLSLAAGRHWKLTLDYNSLASALFPLSFYPVCYCLLYQFALVSNSEQIYLDLHIIILSAMMITLSIILPLHMGSTSTFAPKQSPIAYPHLEVSNTTGLPSTKELPRCPSDGHTSVTPSSASPITDFVDIPSDSSVPESAESVIIQPADTSEQRSEEITYVVADSSSLFPRLDRDLGCDVDLHAQVTNALNLGILISNSYPCLAYEHDGPLQPHSVETLIHEPAWPEVKVPAPATKTGLQLSTGTLELTEGGWFESATDGLRKMTGS